jgi:hypothetical protein
VIVEKSVTPAFSLIKSSPYSYVPVATLPPGDSRTEFAGINTFVTMGVSTKGDVAEALGRIAISE